MMRGYNTVLLLVFCSVKLTLMHKQCLVTSFLGRKVRSSHTVSWPIRIYELHDRMNVLEVDENAGRSYLPS